MSTLLQKLAICTVIPIATVVTYSRAVNAETSLTHPQRFVASGCDKEALESVQSEWKIRNQGIGLRDVRRSGGGV
ncbi:hypothetical protein BC943DRAFT_323905 [Umbelopsis sp. AD052]|nr:hypothetical protein BC943DRAFT_323905 [Umbelopsis sp. AD052]